MQKFICKNGTYINLDAKRPTASPEQLAELKENPAVYELFCERVRAYNNSRYHAQTKDPENGMLNTAKIRAKQREWRKSESGKEKLAAYMRKWRGEHLQARLAGAIRHTIWKAMFLHTDIEQAEFYLGCSISKYKQYLKRKWLHGMSWLNYGKGRGKWCIDHKIPLSMFDLAHGVQVVQVFNYRNTQPIWFDDNCSKWHLDKKNPPHVPWPSFPSSSPRVP